MLFSGEDDKKGAVRLILDGVKYQMEREGRETTHHQCAGHGAAGQSERSAMQT
jgi:hypothetical protein